ncbi:phosphoprotein phosphatase 1 family protein, partial [Dictyocaulus viviparus]
DALEILENVLGGGYDAGRIGKIWLNYSPISKRFLQDCLEMDLDQLIRDHFASGPVEHIYSSSFLMDLLQRAEISLSRQPSLLEVTAPIVVVGDIHGQYGDLLNIFEKCGWPFETRYLFLGDYVDRGRNSLEVLVLVLALQIQFPNQFYLLRGNHEIKSVNRNYGFYSDLRMRFPDSSKCDILMDAVAKVYAQLPLAALLCEKMLCLHGGLSPKLQSIDDIRKIKRGMIEPSGLVEDLLWSDPSPLCCGFKANEERGCSYVFGSDVIADRCAKLGILMIVRGHQVSADRKVTFKQFTKQDCATPRWCSVVVGTADQKSARFKIESLLLSANQVNIDSTSTIMADRTDLQLCSSTSSSNLQLLMKQVSKRF